MQVRTQITWDGEEDPLRLELLQEAELRGISLAQHIYDLLRSRYLARRGVFMGDLLNGMPQGGQLEPLPPRTREAGRTGPPARTERPARTPGPAAPPQAPAEAPPEAARLVANAMAGLLSDD